MTLADKWFLSIAMIIAVFLAGIVAGRTAAMPMVDRERCDTRYYEDAAQKMTEQQKIPVLRESKVRELEEHHFIKEETETQIEKEEPLYYSVNGTELEREYQDWAYDCLCRYGHPEYFPYFLAQMYQESTYDIYQITDGLDYGICQLRITSHGWFKDMAGRHDWDLCNSVYDNIECGAFLMSRYLSKNDGNIDLALSDYFSGEAWWSPEYVQQVSRWFPTVKQIN